jgi:hypothetical protein
MADVELGVSILASVRTEAQKLAGEGKKIQYTHVLGAFPKVYGAGGLFARVLGPGIPVSTDLERAEALALLVEQARKATQSDANLLALQEVGGALRRWTSLPKETKGKIDQVVRSTLPKRKDRVIDAIKEFFYDLGAIMTRLSSAKDKEYAKGVCGQMDQRWRRNEPLENAELSKAQNRAQAAFLQSVKAVYLQRTALLEADESEKQARIEFINDAGNVGQEVGLEEISRRIADLSEKQTDATWRGELDLIDENITKLQKAKADKYFQTLAENSPAGQTGDDTVRAQARENAEKGLKELRDSERTSPPAKRYIEQKLKDISKQLEEPPLPVIPQ